MTLVAMVSSDVGTLGKSLNWLTCYVSPNRVCESMTLCMDAPGPEENTSRKVLSLAQFMKYNDHVMDLEIS